MRTEICQHNAQTNASMIFAKLYERFDRNKDQVLPHVWLLLVCSLSIISIYFFTLSILTTNLLCF